MTTLEYKGYIGSVTFDAEAGHLYGTVVNTRDVITFVGESVAEVRQAFADSVEDYLAFCAELGEQPEKPMSGKFNVRISPQLHAYAAASAASQGISLNALVERAIEASLGHNEKAAVPVVEPCEDTTQMVLHTPPVVAQLSRQGGRWQEQTLSYEVHRPTATVVLH
nr:type II toxin-antitoxin system HicB family antitoxin [Deinococcus sp. RIT780]